MLYLKIGRTQTLRARSLVGGPAAGKTLRGQGVVGGQSLRNPCAQTLRKKNKPCATPCANLAQRLAQPCARPDGSRGLWFRPGQARPWPVLSRPTNVDPQGQDSIVFYRSAENSSAFNRYQETLRKPCAPTARHIFRTLRGLPDLR